MTWIYFLRRILFSQILTVPRYSFEFIGGLWILNNVALEWEKVCWVRRAELGLLGLSYGWSGSRLSPPLWAPAVINTTHPGPQPGITTVVTHKRGCVIHTRLTHGVAFYQNVGTRSNYIFKLSGKTIKKSNNSKNLSFNWRTGYKSSDFQISSSIFGIIFHVHFKAGDHQDWPLLHGCSDTTRAPGFFRK